MQIQIKNTKKYRKICFKFNAGALICQARGGCHKDILIMLESLGHHVLATDQAVYKGTNICDIIILLGQLLYTE